MFVRGRRAAVAVVAVVAVSGAGGCGTAASKPVSLPALSPTTTATPTPTSTADELAAVTAVVRRYFELVNGPTTESAANELFAMMTPGCKCRRVAQSVRDAAVRAQRYFGSTSIKSFVPNIDGPHEADVLVVYDSTLSGLRDSDGRSVHTEPGRNGISADFRLVLAHQRWLIDIVQIISEGRPA